MPPSLSSEGEGVSGWAPLLDSTFIPTFIYKSVPTVLTFFLLDYYTLIRILRLLLHPRPLSLDYYGFTIIKTIILYQAWRARPLIPLFWVPNLFRFFLTIIEIV